MGCMSPVDGVEAMGGLGAVEAEGDESRVNADALNDADGTRVAPNPGPGRPRVEREA